MAGVISVPHNLFRDRLRPRVTVPQQAVTLSPRRGVAGLGVTEGPLNFKMVSGVAQPQDLLTLGWFQGLQRALNDRAGSVGLKRTAVDGDIGPDTLRLAREVFVEGIPGADIEFSRLLLSTSNLAAGSQAFLRELGKAGAIVNTTPDPAKARRRPPDDTPSLRSFKKRQIPWGWIVVGGLAVAGTVLVATRFGN